MNLHERGAVLAHLGALANDLPDVELEVIVRIAERVTMGLRHYGPMAESLKHKDFAREALEEALDQAVYTAGKLTTLTGAGEPRSPALPPVLPRGTRL